MSQNKFITSILKTCVILILAIFSFIAISTAQINANKSAIGIDATSGKFSPHYVAPGVKLVAADNVSPNTVQYTYVLEQVNKDSPELKNISQNLKASLIKELKNKKETQVLRDNKINLIFVYTDIRNMQLFRVVLNYGEY